MPLNQMPDTRIAGSAVGGGAPGSPFPTLGALMQIKEQQQVRQAKMREQEDDNALQTSLGKYGASDDAISDLQQQGRHGVAGKLATQVYKERADQAESYVKMSAAQLKRFEVAGQIAASITDEASFKVGSKAIGATLEPIMGKGIYDQLGTTYDPERLKQLIKLGTTRAQQIQIDHNASTEMLASWTAGLTKGPNGEVSINGQKIEQGHRNTVATILKDSPSQEFYDARAKGYIANGGNVQFLKDAGPWNPDPKERAKQADVLRKSSLTANEESTIEHQRVIEDQGAQRIAATKTRDDRAAADRAAKAAKGDDGTPARGSTLSATAVSASRKARNTENEKIETWAREQFKLTAPKPVVKDGKMEPPLPFDLNLLSDATKTEYVRRRLQNENDHRDEIQQLPLAEAGARAAEAGDVAGYKKIANVYDSLTQGLAPKFATLVPPPTGPASRPNTPEGKKARFNELSAAIIREQDPVKHAAMQRELATLIIR